MNFKWRFKKHQHLSNTNETAIVYHYDVLKVSKEICDVSSMFNGEIAFNSLTCNTLLVETLTTYGDEPDCSNSFGL